MTLDPFFTPYQDLSINIPVKINGQGMLEKKIVHPFNDNLKQNSDPLQVIDKAKTKSVHLYSQLSNAQSKKSFLKMIMEKIPPKKRNQSMTLLKSLGDAGVIDFDANENIYTENFKIPDSKVSKLLMSMLFDPTGLVQGEKIVLKHLHNHSLNQIQIYNPHKWNISRKKYLNRNCTPLKKRLFKKNKFVS